MRKSLLVGTLALVGASAFGQGFIVLDNYDTYGPVITYPSPISNSDFNFPGFPANGVSGPIGTPGTGLLDGWTVGIYYALGTPSITDPEGAGMPDPALALATGYGSTASFYTSTYNTPGEFQSEFEFNTGAAVGSTVTVELVVYDTAAGSYADALYRFHSPPFTMPTTSIVSQTPSLVGDYMPYFALQYIPEPTTLALAGLGACLWMACGRRKNF